jgi:hypothetical protein
MPFHLWVFAKTFAKVSYFRHKYFAKTKSEFPRKLLRKHENENFRPNPKRNTMVCGTLFSGGGLRISPYENRLWNMLTNRGGYCACFFNGIKRITQFWNCFWFLERKWLNLKNQSLWSVISHKIRIRNKNKIVKRSLTLTFLSLLLSNKMIQNI